MNRSVFIIAAALMLALVPISAQEKPEQQEHLKFKQTEIKGQSDQFLADLKDKGFSPSASTSAELSGLFAGQEVTVTTDKTCISATVYQVCARMKSRTNWKAVEADYDLFKKNLIKKYGSPSITKEKFSEPYRKGDGYEIKAASNGKVEYFSCWVLPQGEITIQIVSGGKDLALLIRYADAQGSRLHEEEKTELFLQDL